MQKQYFTEILKNPYHLDEDTMLLIEELCKKYPYCQTTQILLAKCYQKNNSPSFEKQVNLASAYSINRRKFQNYISERQHIYNKQKEILEEHSEYKNPGDMSSAPDKNISQDDKQTTDTISAQPQEDTLDKTSEIKNTKEGRKKELEQIVINRLKSFKKKNPGDIKEAPILPSTNLKGKSPKNSKQDDLIEKFIREEPSINNPKNAKPSDEDLSVDSVKFNDDIVSETLAEIYLKQGRRDRALNIYNKLCLKFPEKSRFFAKKIEDIKNNII